MPLASYNFKKGVDLPSWHWLNQFLGGNSSPGTSNAWDGSRYIYWAIQSGSTTVGSNSTTQLWRFDTFTNGWQFLITLTSGNQGLDIEFDSVRNVIWIVSGNAATEWRYFNLNSTSITLAGQTIAAMALSAAIATVLPAIPGAGSSISFPDEIDLPVSFVTGTAKAGSTATSLVDSGQSEFHGGHIGCYLRYTAGPLAGQARAITAVTNANTLTTTAFGGAPGVGDAYSIEMPGSVATPLAATGGSATTLVAAGAGWVTNIYRDADVIIVAGTGIGQRRRIGSNDGTTLTLAAAVGGNPRTGNWTTAPDATSTFRIVPSTDFVYFQGGTTSAVLYRADVVATALAWSTLTSAPATPGSGANLFNTVGMAPFSLVLFRGAATSNVYRYDIGLATWASITNIWAGETLTTGGTTARLPGRNRFFVSISASQRAYLYSVATGQLEPFPTAPYAAPSGFDGKRSRYVKTVDGVEWIYLLRAGGSEFFRIPLEWIGP